MAKKITDYRDTPALKVDKQSSDRRIIRARSHCGKQNAKRCVFMTVARQICIFEYGVSLSGKCELKRTQTKTGVSEGEKIHVKVNAAKRELINALFSSQKPKVFDC